MKEPLAIEGQWWAEGFDKPPSFGCLTYDPSTGLSLEIKNPRSGEPTFPRSRAEGPSIPNTLVGRDQFGQPVTLFGCKLVNQRSPFGLESLTISPTYAITGREYGAWEDVKFENVYAEFSLLHHWVDNSLIEFNRRGAVGVTVKTPETTEIAIRDGVKLELWPTYGYKSSKDGVEFTESHGIQFKFNESVFLGDAIKNCVLSIQRFLTLMVHQPVAVDKITCRPNDDLNPREVTVLRANRDAVDCSRDGYKHHMLAEYSDVEGSIAEVLRKWFEIEESVGDVLSLYFATVFVPELYSNQEFLFLAQALEVYHRQSSKFSNSVQSKSEFRDRRNRILECVPDEEEEWLKEKLQHANEKTLAQRLEEIVSEHQEPIGQFVDDVPEFCNVVRRARNHYTHYSSGNRRDTIPDGVHLAMTTHRLQAIVELCLLSQLGIAGAPVKRLIDRVRNIRYFEL